MSEQPDEVRVDSARTLILIARDIRLIGDLPVVRFSEEGITDHPLTLAGWLELIAMQLDWDGCMKNAVVGPDDDPRRIL